MQTEGLCAAEGPQAKKRGERCGWRKQPQEEGRRAGQGDRAGSAGWEVGPDTMTGKECRSQDTPHRLPSPPASFAARRWQGRASLEWFVIPEGTSVVPPAMSIHTDLSPRSCSMRAGTGLLPVPARALAWRRSPVNVG